MNLVLTVSASQFSFNLKSCFPSLRLKDGAGAGAHGKLVPAHGKDVRVLVGRKESVVRRVPAHRGGVPTGVINSTDLENFVMGSWTGLEGKDLAARD